MSSKRWKKLKKEHREKQNRLFKITDVFAPAAMALGVFLAPWTYGIAHADNVTGIVRDDGTSAGRNDIENIGENGVNIYPSAVNGSIAVNRFSQFNVAQGEVANMLFNKKGTTPSSDDPAHLLNFVNSSININGTINAIRNNNIGGHLYFLSKGGIVVGASGAINAGKLTAVAGKAYPVSDDAALTVGADIVGNSAYLLNMDGDKTGTDIKIFGKINAPDGVDLISNTNIIVGDKDAASTANKAIINTQGSTSAPNTIDFSTLVNLTDEQKTSLNLGNSLQLSRSDGANGNVVLVAKATSANAKIDDTGWLHNAVNDTAKTSINIEQKAEITAAGTVDISATSKQDINFGTYGTYGSAGSSVAEININGDITAGNQLLVQANSIYDYEANILETLTSLARRKVQNAITGLVDLTIDLGFVGSSSNATVNIGQGAKFTAQGVDTYTDNGDGTRSLLNRALTIKANSTNILDSNPVKAPDGTNGQTQVFASIGALYQYNENDAHVNIGQGAELKATQTNGGVAISSTATTSSTGEVKIKKKADAQGAAMSGIGIVVGLGDTTNDIVIAQNVKIEGQSAVDVKANTNLTTNLKATVKDNDSTYINTAIVYSDMDSTADINVKGDLTSAAGQVDITAANGAKVVVSASNSEGPATIDDITYYLDDAAGILTEELATKAFYGLKKVITGDGKPGNANWSEANIPSTIFTAGAAVNIVDSKNTATINIANTSTISGYTGVNLDAQSLLNGMTLGAVSSIKAENDGGVGASAAILISKLENEAIINISQKDEDNANSTQATVLRSDNGKIKANTLTKYEWNRAQNMVKAVKDTAKALKDYFTAADKELSEEDMQALNTLCNLTDDPSQNASPTDILNLTKTLNNSASIKGYITGVPEQIKNLSTLIKSVEAFINAASYVDVNVGSVARGHETTSAAEIAGTVAVTDFIKKSEINIGQNAKLISGNNDIEMLAKTVQKDVAFYGTLDSTVIHFNQQTTGYGKALLIAGIDPKFIPAMNQGGDAVVGGNVGVDKNVSNSIIQIDDGVELTGNNVKLDAENDVHHVAFALGGGEASSAGVTGMATISTGESKSIIQIDNTAKITARADAPGTADAYNVALNAKNDTSIVLIAGDYTSGDKAGLGVSIGVASFDVITKAEIGNFITAATTMGYVDANSVKVNAFTDGTINTITVAGAAAGGHTDTKHNQKVRNNQAEDGPREIELQDLSINANGQGADAPEDNGNIDIHRDAEGNAQPQAAAAAQQNAENDSTVALAGAGSISWNSVINETSASVDGIRVGKSSVPEGGTMTPGTLDTNAAKLHVAAEDDSYIGAYSGAMALTVMGQNNQASFEATLAGAVAVNDLKKTTKSHIDATANSEATINATDLSNQATNKGEQVAAGLSLGIQRKEGAGANIAASASINLINSTVEAEIKNNNINKNTSILGGSVTNVAYDKDLQIAGGVTAQYTKSSLGVGAAVTVNNVKNTISALMSGNNIGGIVNSNTTNYLSTVNNLAVSKLTQIGTAVSIGISSSEKNVGTVNGAVAVNTVTNNVKAEITDSNIYTGKLSSEAKDGNLGTESVSQKAVQLKSYGFDIDMDEAKATANNTKLKETPDTTVGEHYQYEYVVDADGKILTDKTVPDPEKGEKYVRGPVVDAEGKVVYENGGYKDSSVDGELNVTGDDKDKTINYTAQKAKVDNSGNLIVGTAAAVAVAGKSNFGLGAGVVYNKVDNDFTATYSGGSIITNVAVTTEGDEPNININAKSDTLMVGVAAGVAAHTTKPGVSVAGSVVLQNIDNDTLATLENVNVEAHKVQVAADTTSTLTTVAGMASVSLGGNGAAVGMTWAQNDLANTTGAYVKGMQLLGNTAESLAYNPNLDVKAINNSNTWAIGVGAGVGEGELSAALTGAYASNNGDNSTEAVIDKYENNDANIIKRSSITKAGKIAATATDTTKLKALGGDIAVSAGSEAGIALGGAVVTNNIGKASNKQQIKAQINNTDIYATEGTDVDVNATNNSGLLSIAVGGAVAAGSGGLEVSAQGSVAVANIYANTDASMTNSKIVGDGSTDDEKNSNNDKATVDVAANSTTSLVNTADGLAVGAGSGLVNIGAALGVAKTNSYADTYAGIVGVTTGESGYASEYYVKNMSVQAVSLNKLTDVGFSASVGAAGHGVGGAATGNITINTISNNTVAELNKVLAAAKNNVAVQADSQELLKNYSGSLSVGAGSVGGVAIGTTVAGNDILGSTSALVTDSDITALGSGSSVDIWKYTKNDTQSSDDYGKTTKNDKSAEGKGLVVTADAYHEMRNISITGGIAGAGSLSVGADVTVATNTIGKADASTMAVITNTSINKALEENQLVRTDGRAEVYVAANDLSDISNHVGTLSIAAAGTAGLAAGVAVENNSVNRGVEAAIVNNADAKKKLRSFDVYVNALNGTNLLASTSGMTVGVGGTAGVAATGVASIDKYTNKTLAMVSGMDILAHSLKVDADRLNYSRKYTNGASIAGGYGAGAASIGVALLDDTSSTDAKLLKSNVQTYKYTASIYQDSVEVEAHNNSNVTDEVGDTAVAIGLGGAAGVTVGVNDIKNTVSAEVSESKIGKADATANSIKVEALNNLKANTTNYVASGSLVGIGVGVGVNTINTGAAVKVVASELYATNDITLKAEENRTLKESAYGANIGIGAISTNVMVNNIGTKLADDIDYESGNGETDASGNKYSTAKIKNIVNDAITKQNETLSTLSKSSGLSSWSAGDTTAQGVQTLVLGEADHKTKLVAGNNVTISNLEHNNIDTKVMSGSFGTVGINVAVSNTSVKENLGVNVANTAVTGKNISVTSLVYGTVENLSEQATAGLADVNVGVAKATHNGSNNINIAGNSFTAAGKDLTATNTNYNVTITAGNDSVIKNTIKALQSAGINGGALYGVAKDAVNVEINIGAGTMNSDGSINTTTAGSANTLQGSRAVAVKAYSNPEVYSKANAASVSVLSGAGTVAEAHAEGSAKLNVFSGNTFDTKTLSLNAYTGVDSDNTNDTSKHTTTKAEVVGTSVSGADVIVNKARTYNKMQAVTNVEANTYQDTVTSTNTLKYLPVMNQDGTQAYTIKAGKTDPDTGEVDLTGGIKYIESTDVDPETKDKIYNIEAGNEKFYQYYILDEGGQLTYKTTDGKTLTRRIVNDVEGYYYHKTVSDTQYEWEPYDGEKVPVVIEMSENMGYFEQAVTRETSTGVDIVYGRKIGDNPIYGAGKNVYLYNDRPVLEHVSQTTYTGATDVTIGATNATSSDADIKGVTVGLAVASGSNYAQTHAENTVLVNVKGGGAHVNNMTICASNADSIDAFADGSGGGIIDISPDAAVIENTIRATTTTNVTGDITAEGKLDIDALRTNNIMLQTDTLSAKLVGGSGNHVDNNVKNVNTTVNVADAKLISNGLVVKAENITKLNPPDTSAVIIDNQKFYDIIRTSGYGGLSIDCGSVENLVDTVATVNIGDSNNVNATQLLSSKGIEINAHTDNLINTDAYGYGAGVIDAGRVTVDNDIISKDTVNIVGSKTSIKNTASDKDLVITAADEQDIHSYSYVETTAGIFGATDSRQYNDLTREASINVKDGNLYSNKDINYYAGKVADGNLALTVMNLEARDYAGAFIEFVNKPTMDNNFDQKNSVVLGKNVNSYSMQDTNLYASLGRQIVIERVAMADWIGETPLQDSVVSTEKGQVSSNLNTNSFIEVNGTAIAGIASKIDVYIGGGSSSSEDPYLPPETANTTSRGLNNGIDQLVVSSEYLQGAKDYKDKLDSSADDYEVVGFDKLYVRLDKDKALDLSLEDFRFGTEDYANALLNRYNALKKLMDEYGQDNKDAYTGYMIERNRIVEILEQENLATITRDASGNISDIVINESVNVGYVEVPYISGSGGNINVYTDVFKGSGTIEAKGAPEVNIINNTNLELKLNGIYVGESGGLITYNGKEIPVGEASDTDAKKTAAINQAITEANKNKTAATFKTALAESTIEGGLINVEDRYQKGNFKVTDPVTQETRVTQNIGYLTQDNYDLVDGQYVLKEGEGIEYKADYVAVKPDIYVQGNINNTSGNVAIINAQGSIYIQGKNVDDSVGISGDQITLRADHGSIYQGFTDGIVNIGASPQDQYNNEFLLSKKFETDIKEYENKEITLNDGAAPSGSWIAGNSVYINAADININGVIQSGYGDYYAQIDATTQDNINKVIQNYDGKTQLTDKQIVRGTAYRVIEGGPVWNEQQGCYVYKMSVYYNPSTQKLVLEDVDNSGGKIYLSGRISSTNTSGKIICLDGVSDVTINNTLNYDLAVGRVNINELEGLIRITDTAYAGKDTTANKEYLAKVTEYTRGGSKSWMLEKGKSDYMGTSLDTAGYTSGAPAEDGTYTYTTMPGLYYSWTQGFNFSEIKYYEKDIKTGGWSIKWSSEETKNNLPSYSTDPIKIVDDGETSRPNGEYVGIGPVKKATDPVFKIDFTKVPTTDMVYTLDQEKSWKSGLFGYYHHTYKMWHTTQGVRTTYVTNLKADNPINVKFVGSTADNGSISVSSTKNIELNGSLGNNKLYTETVEGVTALNEKGSVYVATTGGSIVQNGGNIYGADVTLAAAKNIEHINIKAGDNLNLNAVNTVTEASQIKDATNKIDVTVSASGKALANVTTGYLGAALATGSGAAATYTSLVNTASPTGNAGLVSLTVNGGIGGGNISQATSLSTSYNKLSVENNKLVKTNVTLKNSTDDAPLTAAERIDLTTTNGAIYGQTTATGVTAYNVYGGQYSKGTDTLSASVNAAAEGNITLSQSKGNMRIGKIYSNNGDVNLAANDGSVDDALPYVESDADTQSQLIKRWMDLGMIEPDAGYTPDETITKAKQIKATVEKDFNDNFKQGTEFATDTYPKYLEYKSEIAEIEAIPEKERTAEQKSILLRDKEFVNANEALCKYYEKNYQGYINDDGSLNLTSYLKDSLTKEYTDNIRAQYVSLEKLKAMPKRTAAQEEQYQYLLKTYGNYADADAFLAHDTESLRYTQRIENNVDAVATYQYWNKDALLYSLQNSIINVDPDNRPTTSLKDPNIIGHDINITVKDAAGFYAIKLDENHKPILDEHGEYIIDTKEINVSTLLDRNESGYINPDAIDDLKLLSQADASTVTWEYRSKDGTIKYTKEEFLANKSKLDSDSTKLEIDRFAIVAKRMPIGVQQNEGADGKLGTLTVTSAATAATENASGSIFLEGRDQKPYDGDPNGNGSIVTIEPITENKDLNLNRIYSEIGSVYISSLGYIFNSDAKYGTADQIINVTGKDIYLLAGGYVDENPAANSLGTINRHLTTNVLYDEAKPGSGWLAAVAGGGIYIDNISTAEEGYTPLKLRNVSSGGDIDIRSDGDIKMQQLQDTEATNYLYTTHDGYITIISRNGSIGAIKGDEATIDENTGLEMEGLRLKNHSKDKNPYVEYDDVYTDGDGEHTSVWKTDAEKAAIDSKVIWVTSTDADGVLVIKGTYTENGITHIVTKHDKSIVTLGAKDGVYVEGITTKVDVGQTDPEGKLNLRIINENAYHNEEAPDARLTNVGITVNGDLNLLNDLDVTNIASVYSEKDIKWDSELKLHADKQLFLGSRTNLKLYNGQLSAGTAAQDGVARLHAGESVYFGMPTPEAGKDMDLKVYGTIQMDAGKDFVMDSGKLGYAEAKDTTKGTNSIDITVGNDFIQNNGEITISRTDGDGLTIHAKQEEGTQAEKGAQNIFLNNGSINASAVKLVADKHIVQKYVNTDDSEASAAQSHSLSAAQLRATAGGLLDLGGRFNELVNVVANSLAPASHQGKDAIVIGNGNSSRKAEDGKALDLNIYLQSGVDNPVNGNVIIHNYANGVADANKNDINLHLLENLTISDNLVLTNDEKNIAIVTDTASSIPKTLTVGNNLLLTAENDVSIARFGNVVAEQKVDIDAKANITNYADVTTLHDEITMDAGHTVFNAGNLLSEEKTINLNADRGSVENLGFIKAKEHIGLVSRLGSVLNYIPESRKEGADYGIESTNGSVAIWALSGYLNNDVAESYIGHVVNRSSIKADKNISIISYNGNVDNSGAIESVNSSVAIHAYRDRRYRVNENDPVIVGSITNVDNGIADVHNIKAQSIELGAAYDVTNNGDMVAVGTAEGSGSINVEAGSTRYGFDGKKHFVTRDGQLLGFGEIDNSGSLTVVNDGSISMTANDDILNLGAMITDGKGNISLTSREGSIYNASTADMLAADGDINLTTKGQATSYYISYEAEITTPTSEELATRRLGQCVVINNRLYACNETRTQYYDVYGVAQALPEAGTTFIEAEIININAPDGSGTVPRVLYTGSTIINEGDAMALKDSNASNKGNIRFYSEHGSIYNKDDFNTLDDDNTKTKYKGKDISTGDIYIIAPEGYIYNNKNLYSKDDIYIAAKEGLDNFSYDIYAEKDVMLLGTGGVAENLQFGNMTISFKSGEAVDANVVNKSKILSNSGNVTIQSYNGSVSNLDGGDIAAFKGNITLAAAKTVDKDSKKIQFIGIDDITDPEHPKVYKGYLGADGTVVTDKEHAVDVDSYVRIRESTGDDKYKTVVRYKVNDEEYTYDFSTYNNPDNVVLGDVAVYREGSVVNYGDLIAGSYEVLADGTINSDKKYNGSITLKSTTADVYNYDDFNKITPDSSVIGEKAEIIYKSDKFGSYAVATGDLLFSAVNGLIYNSKKELVAEGDVTLEAKDALSSFGNDIYAGGSINLIAAEGNLVNKAELVALTGDINLTANNGTVVNLLGADMLALQGNIILNAGAKPEKDEHDYSVMQYVDANGNIGQIDVVNVSDKEKIGSKTLLTDFYYVSDATGKYTFFSGDPKDLRDDTLSSLSAAERASIVSVVKYIDEVVDPATGKTQFVKTYLGDAEHPVNVYEPGSTSDTKALVQFTAVDQEGHTVNMYGIQGNVEAFRVGDVVNRGDAVALKEPVEGVDAQGIVLRSEHGNVSNYDNFSYVDGKTKKVDDSIIYNYTGKTSAGDLLFNEHAKLPSGVNPTEMKEYTVGHWDEERNALVAKSSISLEAPEGYFYSATNIATENNLDLIGKNDIIIGDNVVDVIVGGDFTATSTEGKVGIKDTDLFVGGNVNFVAENGILDTHGSITSVTGSINLQTNNGNVENDGTNLSAFERVDAYADNGVANISGNISSGSYTNSKGETVINTTNNLTHIWSGNGGVNAANANFTSTGSIDIGTSVGNVTVGQITAKAIAAAGSLSGDVVVGNITGDKVILASNDDNGHVTANQINVGTGLVIQADYANLPEIKRLPNSTGMLVMDISGAHGGVTKGDVVITTPGDTRYNTLAVTNAEINVVDGGRLGVQRLRVAGEAHLTAFDFRTAVYGVINEDIDDDRSPALYFDLGKGTGSVENLELNKLFAGRDIKVDPIKGRYDVQLVIDGIDDKLNTLSTAKDNWGDGDNDGWMNLFIDDSKNQRSNGLLLHMDSHRYGHSQRYAADTLGRILTDTKAQDAYERHVEPIVHQYFRFDLLNDGLVAEVAEEEHFFKITNANHMLGEKLNPEDMLGLEKAVLGLDRAANDNDDTEEEIKKKNKKVQH